jgi:hypothetical protein
MIKISTAIYCMIMIPIILWFLSDFFGTTEGSYLFPSKEKYEMGLSGLAAIIVAIIFNLIWGGIYWW